MGLATEPLEEYGDSCKGLNYLGWIRISAEATGSDFRYCIHVCARERSQWV